MISPWTPRKSALAVTLMLTAQAFMLAYVGCMHSPTMDEPAHIASGITHWRSGDLSNYRVNPPLVRLLATAPLVIAGRDDGFVADRTPAEWRRSRLEFYLGRRWSRARGPEALVDVAIARCALIPLVLLGGLVAFWWARDLFGPSAGMTALALWCFSPNILGHGALVTPDAAAASFGVLVGYLYWRWLRSPSWYRAVVTGIAAAVALATKSTWVLLFAVAPLTWAGYRLGSRFRSRGFAWRGIGRQALQLVGMGCVSLFLLGALYGFEGFGKPLGKYEFTSSLLNGNFDPGSGKTGNRFRHTPLAFVSLPLPEPFVTGIDLQRVDFETGKDSYLLGEQRSPGGWWYYYLVAGLVKIPLGTLGLALIALYLREPVRSSDGGSAFVPLLAVPLAVFVLVSSQVRMNCHARYALPVLPFLFIFASRSLARVGHGAPRRQWLGMALLAWTIFETVSVLPHELSYFNQIAGGPRCGHRFLLDSNIDWGQELTCVQRWADQHPERRPLYLAFWGPDDPRVYGIGIPSAPGIREVENTEGEVLTTGWYAISVNRLHDYQSVLHNQPFRPDHSLSGRFQGMEGDVRYFQAIEPVDFIGGSIRIYFVDESARRRICEWIRKQSVR